jgi:hypothetical protein
MNSSNSMLNDSFEELTVSEFARRFGMSENTVRTKINRKKLTTKKGYRDGREAILIVVEHSLDHSLNDPEQSETIQDAYFEQSIERPQETEQLVSFMRETFSTVQNYSHQLVELSRENERYKLLSVFSSKSVSQMDIEIEQLKTQLFEQRAKVRELELQAPDPLLQEKNTELLLLLTTKDTEISALKSQLEAKNQETANLLTQLEQEQKKTAIDKLFRR